MMGGGKLMGAQHEMRWPLLLLLLLLVGLLALGATPALGSQANAAGEPVADSAELADLLDTLMLEWQLARAFSRALGERADPAAKQLAGQLAAHSASLFQTMPRPKVGAHQSASGRPQAPLEARERRMSTMNNVDQVSAIQSLNSLLDEDNSSRLSRAYKPRIMSTARGFGKRAHY